MSSPSQGPRAGLRRLAPRDAQWTSFVASSEDAVSFHHHSWVELIADCYGFSAMVLAVVSDGAVGAGLPVVEVRTLSRRRRWVSLPFTDHCAPLGRPGEPHLDGLVERLEGAMHEERVESFEVRAPLGDARSASEAVPVLHVLSLEADAERVFRRFKRSNQRLIRQAERNDLVLRRAETPAELSKTFYGLHVETRRRLGVPVQPRRFFDLMWERIMAPELGFALIAYSGRHPVAGAVFLAWNGTVTYKYGASDHASWHLRPNNLLMWNAIRWGCEHGFRRFDFGRTDADDHGLRRFKSSWGAQETPLVYTRLGRARPPARGGLGGTSRAVLRASPAWMSRLVGELFYRYAA